MELSLSSFFYTMIVLLSTIITTVVIYLKWKFTFWKKLGIPTLNPSIPFGDVRKVFTGHSNLGELFLDFYKEFKSKSVKHGGVYLGPTPFYVPIDLQLIKHIMVVDFSHFVNHGSYIDEINDPLSAHLFSLEDAKWRNMRLKLTPTFTSGKMKMMFQTLNDCTVELNKIINDYVDKNEAVDIKDILALFTTDIIGSVAFGIECNSLKNPDSLFRKYGKRFFDLSTIERIKGLMTLFFSVDILSKIKFKLTNSEVEDFFMKTVFDTVSYREENNIFRKDFMHLLLQLKNRGFLSDDNKITKDNETQESALTMNELAAQCFVFFAAGFETSSTTMTFALYELAINPEVQEKLRDEVCFVLKKYDNQLTYDGVKEMTYMDQVLNETLRKYPPLPMLLRQCSKDYVIPNTNILIKKGMKVGIPIWGLHLDPEYHPDPEIFNPDRFSDENKNKMLPYTWMPFGEGPRICIGLRFGLMQSKVGLATILRNYKIDLNKRTETPLKFTSNFILAAKDDVWLDVKKLK